MTALDHDTLDEMEREIWVHTYLEYQTDGCCGVDACADLANRAVKKFREAFPEPAGRTIRIPPKKAEPDRETPGLTKGNKKALDKMINEGLYERHFSSWEDHEKWKRVKNLRGQIDYRGETFIAACEDDGDVTSDCSITIRRVARPNPAPPLDT